MNKLLKTVITLTAIGVAVKVILRNESLINGRNFKVFPDGTYKFNR